MREYIPRAEKLMRHVEFDTNGGCWLWSGAMQKGYGTMNLWDRFYGAHRISYDLHKGPIPDGMHVLHKCDVRACVNPDHLFVGTRSDNMKDMMSKGRQKHASGYTRPSKKERAYMIESCKPTNEVARELGRHPSTVARIRKSAALKSTAAKEGGE